MNRKRFPLRGQILNIQHFCVDDGPGIRTTVFFKGCPLRCAWCHNPESHRGCEEILFREDRCALCGECVSLCEKEAHALTPDGAHIYDRVRCTACGNCTRRCPTGALEKVGGFLTVDEVLAELCADRVFYRISGGGVTLSGGEPTAQPEFAEAILSGCKREGFHTCIETCGWCPTESMERLLPFVDLFLVDWKLSDEKLHKAYTGVSNIPILQNLDLLCARGAAVILRCPLIPDVNLEQTHYDSIIALAQKNPNIQQIHLEPYHPMGIGKAKALGITPAYDRGEFLPTAEAEEAKCYIEERISVPVLISGSSN